MPKFDLDFEKSPYVPRNTIDLKRERLAEASQAKSEKLADFDIGPIIDKQSYSVGERLNDLAVSFAIGVPQVTEQVLSGADVVSDFFSTPTLDRIKARRARTERSDARIEVMRGDYSEEHKDKLALKAAQDAVFKAGNPDFIDEVMHTAAQYYDDPSLIANAVATEIPAFLAGGFLGKGAQALSAGSKLTGAVLGEGAVLGFTGARMAGGAKNQILENVGDPSKIEVPRIQEAEYERLRAEAKDSGKSDEDADLAAKLQLLEKRSSAAAALTGLGGAAIARVTGGSKAELGRGSVAKSISREGLEEGLQNPFEGISAKAAAQAYNPTDNADIFEGAGQALVEGTLTGMGTAGTTIGGGRLFEGTITGARAISDSIGGSKEEESAGVATQPTPAAATPTPTQEVPEQPTATNSTEQVLAQIDKVIATRMPKGVVEGDTADVRTFIEDTVKYFSAGVQDGTIDKETADKLRYGLRKLANGLTGPTEQQSTKPQKPEDNEMVQSLLDESIPLKDRVVSFTEAAVHPQMDYDLDTADYVLSQMDAQRIKSVESGALDTAAHTEIQKNMAIAIGEVNRRRQSELDIALASQDQDILNNTVSKTLGSRFVDTGVFTDVQRNTLLDLASRGGISSEAQAAIQALDDVNKASEAVINGSVNTQGGAKKLSDVFKDITEGSLKNKFAGFSSYVNYLKNNEDPITEARFNGFVERHAKKLSDFEAAYQGTIDNAVLKRTYGKSAYITQGSPSSLKLIEQIRNEVALGQSYQRLLNTLRNVPSASAITAPTTAAAAPAEVKATPVPTPVPATTPTEIVATALPVEAPIAAVEAPVPSVQPTVDTQVASSEVEVQTPAQTQVTPTEAVGEQIRAEEFLPSSIITPQPDEELQPSVEASTGEQATSVADTSPSTGENTAVEEVTEEQIDFQNRLEISSAPAVKHGVIVKARKNPIRIDTPIVENESEEISTRRKSAQVLRGSVESAFNGVRLKSTKAFGKTTAYKIALDQNGQLMPEFADTLTLALIDELSSVRNSSLVTRTDALNKMFDTGVTVTGAQVLPTIGIIGDTFVQSLAKSIGKYLPVTVAKEGAAVTRDSIAVGLAQHLVAGLAQRGVVEITRLNRDEMQQYVNNFKSNKMEFIRLARDRLNPAQLTEKVKKLVERANDLATFIESISGKAVNGSGLPSLVPRPIRKMVKRRAQRLSVSQKDALQKANNTKWLFKPTQLKVALKIRSMFPETAGIESLGSDMHPGFFGKSVTSRANANIRDLENIEKLVDLVGPELTQGMYFSHSILSNGRVAIDNTLNYQNSKWLRHLIKPEKFTATLSITDENGEYTQEYRTFQLAIMQGLGVDIDKDLLENSENAFFNILEQPTVIAAVQAIKEYEANPESEDTLENMVQALNDAYETGLFFNEIPDGVISENGTEIKPSKADLFAAFSDSLIELSHSFNDDLSQKRTFTTDAFIEMDGITNGVLIGALMFDPELVEVYGEAFGIFGPNSKYTSFAEYKAAGGMDIYTLVGSNIQKEFEEIEGKKWTDLKDVIKFFQKYYKFTGKDGRGNSKDPTMQTVYGAGIAGILENANTKILGKIYNELHVISQVRNTNDRNKQFATLRNEIMHTLAKAIKVNQFRAKLAKEAYEKDPLNTFAFKQMREHNENITLLTNGLNVFSNQFNFVVKDTTKLFNEKFHKALYIALHTGYAAPMQAGIKKIFGSFIKARSVYNAMINEAYAIAGEYRHNLIREALRTVSYFETVRSDVEEATRKINSGTLDAKKLRATDGTLKRLLINLQFEKPSSEYIETMQNTFNAAVTKHIGTAEQVTRQMVANISAELGLPLSDEYYLQTRASSEPMAVSDLNALVFGMYKAMYQDGYNRAVNSLSKGAVDAINVKHARALPRVKHYQNRAGVSIVNQRGLDRKEIAATTFSFGSDKGSQDSGFVVESGFEPSTVPAFTSDFNQTFDFGSFRNELTVDDYGRGIGVAAAILQIHGADGGTMTNLYRKSQNFFNIFDAIGTNVNEAPELTKQINEEFTRVLTHTPSISNAVDALKHTLKSVGRDNEIDNYPVLLNSNARTVDVEAITGELSVAVDTNAKTTSLNDIDTIGKELTQDKLKVLKNTTISQYNLETNAEKFKTGSDKASLLPKDVEYTYEEKAELASLESELSTQVEAIISGDVSVLGSIKELPKSFKSNISMKVSDMPSAELFDYLGVLDNTEEDPEHLKFLREYVEPFMTLVKDVDLDIQVKRTGGNFGFTDISKVSLSLNNESPSQQSAQELFSHEITHVVLDHGLSQDSVALTRLKELYKKIEDVLTPADLVTDPTNPLDVAEAQRLYDYVFRNNHAIAVTYTDKSTNLKSLRSMPVYLAEFSAHLVTNKKFRKFLNENSDRIRKSNSKPVLARANETWLDKFLNITSAVLKGVTNRIAGIRQGKDVTDDVLILLHKLAGVNTKHQARIASVIDDMYSGVEKTVERLGRAIAKPLDRTINAILQATPYKVSKPVRVTFDAYKDFLNGQGAKWLSAVRVARAATNRIDSSMGTTLMTEIIGRHAGNGFVHDLSRLKTKLVDIPQNRITEHTLRLLKESFVKKLSDADKQLLTNVMRADVQSIYDSNTGYQDFMRILRDEAHRKSLIKDAEADITRIVGSDVFTFIEARSRELATFMITGNNESNDLLLNAYNIARLANTDIAVNYEVNEVAALVDKYVTYLALNKMGNAQLDRLAMIGENNLKEDEFKNGLHSYVMLHKEYVKDAKARLFTPNDPRYMKGYVKEIFDPMVSIAFSTKPNDAELLSEGWKLYEPVGEDPDVKITGNQFLYYNDSNLLGTYNAGVVPLNSMMRRGADIGELLNNVGIIDRKAVSGMGQSLYTRRQVSNAQLASGKFVPTPKGAKFVPVFDGAGNVKGYRYMMSNRTKRAVLRMDEDFDTLLAGMVASTEVRVNVSHLNQKIAKSLLENYRRDETKESGISRRIKEMEWVAIGPKSTNAAIREVWKMMPDEFKAQIRAVWGDSGFKVPVAEFELLFGSREPTVGNLKKNMQDIANSTSKIFKGIEVVTGTLINNNMGRKIEKGFKEAVTYAKDRIVIGYGTVLMGNIISNVMYLRTKGIPFSTIIRDSIHAAQATVKLDKAEYKLFQLNAELNTTTNLARRQALEKSIKEVKLEIAVSPIKFMDDFGLRQTLVEDMDGAMDKFGQLNKSFGRLNTEFNKLPSVVTTPLKVMFMAQDTKLYQFMRTATELSDFTARYTLIKHMVENGTKVEKAIVAAEAAFINYKLPTTRTLQYMNSVGLAMFTKFFIRAQRVITEMLVERPFALITLGLLQGASVDVPDITGDAFVGFNNPLNKLADPLTLISHAPFGVMPLELIK